MLAGGEMTTEVFIGIIIVACIAAIWAMLGDE